MTIIFNLEKLPSTLAILGGGVIACEFACLMQALGVQVTIIEMQADILPTELPGKISKAMWE